jgi:hypothetical protein
MAKLSVGFGVALILLGLVGYFATGAQSPTALIPAGVGLLLVALGLLARNPKLRMHAMHGAALVGLLGFAGSVSGIGQLAKLLGGAAIARPPAAIARSLMAILCLGFVALAVRSFIMARIARRKAAVPPTPAP